MNAENADKKYFCLRFFKKSAFICVISLKKINCQVLGSNLEIMVAGV